MYCVPSPKSSHVSEAGFLITAEGFTEDRRAALSGSPTPWF